MKTALFTGGNDILVDLLDLENIVSAAPNIVFRKDIEDYGHLDFAWAYDADEYVYQYQDVRDLMHKHAQ